MIDVLIEMPDISKALTVSKITDFAAANKMYANASYCKLKKGAVIPTKDYTPNGKRFPLNIITESIYE